MKKIVIFLVVLFSVLGGINSSSLVLGGDSAGVSLEIIEPFFKIFVHSPKNITYEFDKGAFFNLDLNVSANAPVDIWQYVLFEPERVRAGPTILGGNEIANVGFVPNTTLTAVRWDNELNVSALAVDGREDDERVDFYIQVNNSAPIISGIDPEFFICEGTSSLPSFISLFFGAKDIDEMDLFFGIEPVEPAYGLFFLGTNPQQNISPYLTILNSSMISSSLYENPGVYSLNISVGENALEPPLSDTGEQPLADRKSLDLTVIEVNSPPNIINPVGVQTVWNNGDNSTFFHDFNVTDDESGDETLGGLNFNVSFNPNGALFGIDSLGVVNFDASGLLVGVFDVSVCVTDESLPLSNIHPDILTYCGQDGLNQTTCNVFELTITDENRPPEIIDFYPLDLNFSAGGTDSLFFNVSERDPDGTTPDAYWYVDSVFKEFDNMSLIDEFEFSFGCGVSGEHPVRVDVTDGELNTSLQWNVTVNLVSCPSPPASSGGGGGGGGVTPSCVPQWGCDNWRVCRDVDDGLASGALSGDSFRDIRAECDGQGARGDFCGFQVRGCSVINTCDRTTGKPDTLQSCYFTENPSCSDGIKNCHSDSCELLVDCGGPCGPCATCSDGIQNQGEGGVDCGGPCANSCPVELPLKPSVSIYFWILLGLVVLILVVWAYRVWRKKRFVA